MRARSADGWPSRRVFAGRERPHANESQQGVPWQVSVSRANRERSFTCSSRRCWRTAARRPSVVKATIPAMNSNASATRTVTTGTSVRSTSAWELLDNKRVNGRKRIATTGSRARSTLVSLQAPVASIGRRTQPPSATTAIHAPPTTMPTTPRRAAARTRRSVGEL